MEKGLRDGNWRRVVINGAHAIKIPRADRPELTAGARLLNLWEWELWSVWQPRYGWDYLCPSIKCSEDGSELLMRAAVPCVEAQEPALERLWDDIQRRYRYVSPLGECKFEDWGVLDERFVLLDYGAACDNEQAIVEERATLRRHVGAAEKERRLLATLPVQLRDSS